MAVCRGSGGGGGCLGTVQSCLQTWVPWLCPRPRKSGLDVLAGGRAIGTRVQRLCVPSADTGLVRTADGLLLSPPSKGAQLVPLPAPCGHLVYPCLCVPSALSR